MSFWQPKSPDQHWNKGLVVSMVFFTCKAKTTGSKRDSIIFSENTATVQLSKNGERIYER
jgi:hypothetical protein